MPVGLPLAAETIRKHSTWFTVYGIALILLGVVVFIAPGFATPAASTYAPDLASRRLMARPGTSSRQRSGNGSTLKPTSIPVAAPARSPPLAPAIRKLEGNDAHQLTWLHREQSIEASPLAMPEAGGDEDNDARRRCGVTDAHQSLCPEPPPARSAVQQQGSGDRNGGSGQGEHDAHRALEQDVEQFRDPHGTPSRT